MPKVKWAKPYLTILEPRIQEWARANGDRRHEVENEVLLAVQSAHKEGGSSKALPVNLLSVSFFYASFQINNTATVNCQLVQ